MPTLQAVTLRRVPSEVTVTSEVPALIVALPALKLIGAIPE